MESAPISTYSSDLIERAARIRLVCFDVDGTLTDGRLYIDADGREGKAFHVQDGQGMVLLRDRGVHVALITARQGKVVEHRAGELRVEAYQGVKDKLAQVQALCERYGIGLEQVAFMGDDLADLTCLRAVGLAVVPANAHAWVRDLGHWRTAAGGGEGAARELCDLLLHAQGHIDAILAGAPA